MMSRTHLQYTIETLKDLQQEFTETENTKYTVDVIVAEMLRYFQYQLTQQISVDPITAYEHAMEIV